MKFSTTGQGELPSHLKILLAGTPKSGKTSFAGTIPNVLIADTEGSANNLQSIAHLDVPFVSITSSDDLRQLLLMLRDSTMRAKIASDLGVPPIEAVVIDTLDSFQEILKQERLRETRQSVLKRDDWSWLLETMTRIVTSFCALPMHVVFTVHTKIQNLGSDDDLRTTVMPALNGQMAERIAGMVGYSLATFRQEEIDAAGSPRTVYWLRTEGDETHPNLGNRAAGRLPAVIAPNFETILGSLAGGAPTRERKAVEITSDVESPEADVLEPSIPEAATEPADEPEGLSAAAISHLAKLWKDLGLTPFRTKVPEMSMQQARDTIVMWQALQADFADGKVEDPEGQMKAYLFESGWATPPKARKPRKAAQPKPSEEPEAEARPEPEPEVETQPQPKPEPEVEVETEVKAEPEVEVETEAEEEPEEEPEVAEVVEIAPKRRSRTASVKQDPALATVAEGLGGTVVDVREGSDHAPCEECGNPIDDADIAALGMNRFGKWLCVDDYRVVSREAKTK